MSPVVSLGIIFNFHSSITHRNEYKQLSFHRSKETTVTGAKGGLDKWKLRFKVYGSWRFRGKGAGTIATTLRSGMG